MEESAAGWGRGGPHKGKLKDKMGNPRAKEEDRGGTTPATALGQWFKDMEVWGRRVRRDIILLEAYLREVNPTIELYDDPGDPPPPPNSFF
jgi:hypothetical protein